MCGISGCVNKKTAMVSAVNALNKLQNRGYDSAGICTVKKNKLLIKKYVSDCGENAISSIKSDPLSCIKCNIAIGHTRWATHGAKTVLNAHPHHDDQYRFSMVHNGIIENYLELKNELVANGYQFYGQTDTEIVVKYLDYVVNNGNDYSYLSKCLKGSWAILFVDILEPNKIFFLKNGSPLIIGFDNNKSKIMLVSEFIGFDSDIESYFIVGDNDHGYVTLSDDVCSYYNSTKHTIIAIPPDIILEEHPDPFPYWTIKEINDQPKALTDLIQSRIYPQKPSNENQLENQLKDQLVDSEYMVRFPEFDCIKNDVLNVEHLIFLACGTSYHAAQIGARFFKELYSNFTIEVIDGADFEEIDIPSNRRTMMVLLSQSGETKDLYRTLVIGKERGIRTIGIINVENSLIAREVDVCLYLKAGREHAVASTKSFSNQVIMLLMVALWMNQNNDLLDKKIKKKYYDAIMNIAVEYSEIITKAVTEMPSIVPLFNNKSDCFILGKHLNEWIAKEGSLKIKEISYIHSEGFSAAALKHGPFALLTEGTPIILLANDDCFYSKIENVTAEVKSRLATVIHITNKKVVSDKVDFSFYYETSSILFPLLSIVPLQVLAYELSLDRGNNPDYPRNLAKVVTVE